LIYPFGLSFSHQIKGIIHKFQLKIFLRLLKIIVAMKTKHQPVQRFGSDEKKNLLLLLYFSLLMEELLLRPRDEKKYMIKKCISKINWSEPITLKTKNEKKKK